MPASLGELGRARPFGEMPVDPVVAGSSPVALAQFSQALAATLDRRGTGDNRSPVPHKCLLCRSCCTVWQTGVGRPAPVSATKCPVTRSDTHMANLGQKGGVYHVRFRFRGKEYKKSLKTPGRVRRRRPPCTWSNSPSTASTPARLAVPDRRRPRRLRRQRRHPRRARRTARRRTRAAPCPPPGRWSSEYTAAQKPLLAPSYHASQAMHLRHLLRHLGGRADDPCDAGHVPRPRRLPPGPAGRAAPEHRRAGADHPAAVLQVGGPAGVPGRLAGRRAGPDQGRRGPAAVPHRRRDRADPRARRADRRASGWTCGSACT